MDVIHKLIINHDLIKRSVTNLPDGIRTVTESDDARIAQFIKTHVASMGERVDAQRDPNLPIESQALHTIFRNKDKIKTTVETTEKGVIVIQISGDQETVAALQQHASEVSDLVRGGMFAVQTAMMRNGVFHSEGMHMRMHGGMRPDRLDRSSVPDAR
jgi:acylphosphatase